jgi:outer membrane protein, heavy metal efflux system
MRATTPHRCAVPVLVTLLLAPAGVGAQEGEALTLPSAVHAALARSPEVQRAEASRARARAERTEGWGAMLPRLSLASGVSRIDVLQRTATDPLTGGIVQLPDSLVDTRRGFGTSAVASVDWTVFAGGRHLARNAAARSRGHAAENEVAATRVQVEAEATIAYLDALEAEALVEVRRAEEAQAAELERTALARFETGQVPEIDLLQARLAASEAAIAALDAHADARLRRLALLTRLGMSEDGGERLAPPEALPALDTASLQAHLLAASPVLARLRAEREAARTERNAGRRALLLPTVRVGVDHVWSEWGQSRDAFTLEPRNTQVQYRLALGWSPLERPGAMFAEGQRGTAALMTADAELRGGELRVRHEIAGAVERWARAQAVATRSRLNLALAERQREQAEERYRLGLAPLTERLHANALWAEAARQEVLARHAPLRAVAELEHATGVPVRAGALR